MNRMIPEKSYYEIEKFLGEGLTSQVYKAFRKDPTGYTAQPVALKIVKSKKHIQVLRQEFEKLLKVRSDHCVHLLAWESLEQGPALVLEYLEGMTLQELCRTRSLSEVIIQEIMRQIQLGLKDLHSEGLVHGDLNLKNIFITQQGKVKLLDFGVYQDDSSAWGTPEFMAPEIWRGESYTNKSDLFSLGLIEAYLKNENSGMGPQRETWQDYLSSYYGRNELLNKDPRKRAFLNIESHFLGEKKLKKLVNHVYLENISIMETQVLEGLRGDLKTKRKKSYKQYLIGLVAGLMLTFWTPLEASPQKAHLEVRSLRAIPVSINGLPYQHMPSVGMTLRPGKYRLMWKQSYELRKKNLQLSEKQTFILKPESVHL